MRASLEYFFSLQVFESITREVQKGGVKCGVASIAVGCNIYSSRDIAKFAVAYPDIPGSPLALWVEENPEAMQSLERAMTAAQLQLVMLRSAKKSGNKEKFAELLKVDLEDEEVEEQDGLGDLTPPIPVMQMNIEQRPDKSVFPEAHQEVAGQDHHHHHHHQIDTLTIIMIIRQREHHHLYHHIHHQRG